MSAKAESLLRLSSENNNIERDKQHTLSVHLFHIQRVSVIIQASKKMAMMRYIM